MFVVIWEYEVHAGREAEFVSLYGDDGEWVALFREYDGYIGTELLRDARAANRFLSIDRWSFQEDYERFLAAAESRYAQIDARGDALTAAERRLGAYTAS